MNYLKNVMYYIKSKAKFYVCIFLVLVLCLVIILSSNSYNLLDAVEFDISIFDIMVIQSSMAISSGSDTAWSNVPINNQNENNNSDFILVDSSSNEKKMIESNNAGKKSIVSNNAGKARNIQYLHFRVDDFDNSSMVIERIQKLMKINKNYSVLIKILRTNGTFGMAGSQINFCLSVDHVERENDLRVLYKTIFRRIENFMNEYKNIRIEFIQLMFVEINIEKDLKIKNVNKIKFNKDVVNIGETKRFFNDNYLPITMDKNYYGNEVHYTLDDKNYRGTKEYLGESSKQCDALRQIDIRGRRGRGGGGMMEQGVSSTLLRQDNEVNSPVPLSSP